MIPISKYNTCRYLISQSEATQVEELQCHPTLPHPLASQAEPNQDP